MTRRALELAAFGIGQVSPSPLVGCVIVAENGEIVGEGTYIFENVTHAEVIALKQAGEKAKAGRRMFRLSRTRISGENDALHRGVDKCRNQARRLSD